MDDEIVLFSLSLPCHVPQNYWYTKKKLQFCCNENLTKVHRKNIQNFQYFEYAKHTFKGGVPILIFDMAFGTQDTQLVTSTVPLS